MQLLRELPQCVLPWPQLGWLELYLLCHGHFTGIRRPHSPLHIKHQGITGSPHENLHDDLCSRLLLHMVPSVHDRDMSLQHAWIAAQDGFLELRCMGGHANPSDIVFVHKHLLLQHADIYEYLSVHWSNHDVQAPIRETLESKLLVLRIRPYHSLSPSVDSSDTPESARKPGIIRVHRSGNLRHLLSDCHLVGGLRLSFYAKTRYE